MPSRGTASSAGGSTWWWRPRPARVPNPVQGGDSGGLPGVVLWRGLVPGEDLVETGEDVGVEVDLQGALRGVQLPEGARPDDGRGHAVLVQQPGEGHVRWLLTELAAQFLPRLNALPVRLDDELRPAGQAAAPLALRGEDAAEQSALKRGPGDDADPVGASGGQHLKLDPPGGQVVQRLLADQAEEAASPGGLAGLGDVPAGEVGGPGVKDLALRDEHLHRLPDLVPRGVPVDMVHLVQVDVVGPQPAQRRVAGAADVERGELPLVGPGAHVTEQLGRQDRLPTPPAALGEPVAQDLLGPPGVRLVVVGYLPGRRLTPTVGV